MAEPTHEHLSRRERQIMDVLYAQGKATAAEVMDQIPEPPSYSAVRALLRILEEKGHIFHEKVGPRYVYLPTVSREKAKKSALGHVVSTFFGGSVTQAVAALLDMKEGDITQQEMAHLADLIDDAKQEGR